ncbi:MAG: tetraacyldisaccharide 4'-kinase [Sphingobacteriales bacterium]|jgi:tetraacyldisaccharide 4'-kinase
MEKLRLILYPFSILYGIVLEIRNRAFDWGWLPVYKSKVTVISVGNLSIGGSGKSPMVEFLLENYFLNKKVAVLSRGYGRKSEGFVEVEVDSDALLVGDEPLQTKMKFPNVTVAVCEDRVSGIKILERNHEVILMDDAFQHRYVKPKFQILLTSATLPYCDDFVLPAGNLREFRKGKNRSDLVVLTKMDEHPSEEEVLGWRRKLSIKDNVPLLFSTIEYKDLVPLNDQVNRKVEISKRTCVYLITGIADSTPLVRHIMEKYKLAKHFKFADHYPFAVSDLEQILEDFKKASDNSVIFTTQKDAVKLNRPELKEVLEEMPIYALKMVVGFSPEDKNVITGKLEELC